MADISVKCVSEPQVPRWLAVSKDIFQIVALITAGIWAYFYYDKLESPDNFDRLVISLKTPVDVVHSEQCFLRLLIELRNAGKSPLTVDKQTVSAWVVQMPRPEHPDIQYLDILKWREGAPILTLPEPGDEDWPLTGRYPSGAADAHSLGFRVKHGPRRVVLFLVETSWTLDGVPQKDRTTWSASACPPVAYDGHDGGRSQDPAFQVPPKPLAQPAESTA